MEAIPDPAVRAAGGLLGAIRRSSFRGGTLMQKNQSPHGML
jgi:hypothetical protein